jgi:hypothetical protein
MSVEIRNAPGQPGHALLVFNRDVDAGSLKLAIQNRMSRKYLGPSVGKANWSPARSHFFDAALVSCSDGVTVFKIGPEAASFIPDEASIEFTSEDNAICENAVWSGILPPFVSPASAPNPEAEAEVKREAISERGREYRSADTDAGRETGVASSPSEHAVPAPRPTTEQAVSRNPLHVETTDEKLDQLIAAFVGELETEAVMDSTEPKARSSRPVQPGAKTEADGLVDETVQIVKILSDAKARRTKSATDWFLLFSTLGFLYLSIKMDGPNGNGGLFFLVVAGICGVWWISRLKVGSGNTIEDKSS